MTTDLEKSAWKARREGRPLTDEERQALNARQKQLPKHLLYFSSPEQKERLRELAKDHGYDNFSHWLLAMVQAGIDADGISIDLVRSLEDQIAAAHENYDRIQDLYAHTAADNKQLREDNHRLAAQLERLLSAVLPEFEVAE